MEARHPEKVKDRLTSKNGLIKTAGAAYEWMAMMEEDKIKEQKKREAEERAMVRKAKRAKKVQEKEAMKQCSAVFKSGKSKGSSVQSMCLPDTKGQRLCKRHMPLALMLYHLMCTP